MLAALLVLALSQVATAQSDTIPVDLNIQVPAVQVGDVTVVGPTEVVAKATIDTNGLATNVFVQYGTDGILNLTSPKVTLAAGLDLQDVVLQLLGLEPGSVIQYRVVAENSAGTSTSPISSITMPPAGSGGSSSTTSTTVVDLTTGQAVVGSAALGRRTVRCTVVGTSRSEVLRGTSHNDVICGLGGNDRIKGLRGNDVLVGGPGRDRLNGNRGSDRLYGNAGNDKLVSRDRRRRDRVDGGTGRDRATVDRGDRSTAVERTVRRPVRG
jgi:Ca2+-binding RTX toxin-like protein